MGSFRSVLLARKRKESPAVVPDFPSPISTGAHVEESFLFPLLRDMSHWHAQKPGCKSKQGNRDSSELHHHSKLLRWCRQLDIESLPTASKTPSKGKHFMLEKQMSCTSLVYTVVLIHYLDLLKQEQYPVDFLCIFCCISAGWQTWKQWAGSAHPLFLLLPLKSETIPYRESTIWTPADFTLEGAFLRKSHHCGICFTITLFSTHLQRNTAVWGETVTI